jgi:hypothetical protein
VCLKKYLSSSKQKLSHRKQTLKTQKQIVQIPETRPAKSLALIIAAVEYPVLTEFSRHALLCAVHLSMVPC